MRVGPKNPPSDAAVVRDIVVQSPSHDPEESVPSAPSPVIPVSTPGTPRSAADLERGVTERIAPFRRWPMDQDGMSRLLTFILSRGAIETEAWSGAGAALDALPPTSRTVLQQRLRTTRETTSITRATVEGDHPLAEDQLRDLLLVYGGTELGPDARRRIEALLGHVQLVGPHAERDKRRAAEFVLRVEKRRLGAIPIEASTVDKVARIFRLGGMRAEGKAALFELLEKESLTGAARVALDALRSEDAAGTHAPWTFFVHIDGHGTLESNALQDVLEMERIGSIAGEIHVLALVSSPAAHESEWRSGIRLLHVCRGDGAGGAFRSQECAVDPGSALAAYLRDPGANVDMSDPRLLHAALAYVRQEFPCDHMLVNLWGHGRHVGSRESGEGQIIHPNAWSEALGGIGVDVLACDACGMSDYESALAAERAGVKYYLASQDPVPAEGWRYDTVLSRASQAIRSKEGLSPEKFSDVVGEHFIELGDGYPAFTSVRLDTLSEVGAKLSAFAETMVEAGGLTQNPALRDCWDASILPGAQAVDVGDLAFRVGRRFAGPLRQAAIALLSALDASCRLREPIEPGRAEVESAYLFERSGPGERNLIAMYPIREPGLKTGLSIYAPSASMFEGYLDRSPPWAKGAWIALLRTLDEPTDAHREIPPWALPGRRS
jgi:hypothetical protein